MGGWRISDRSQHFGRSDDFSFKIENVHLKAEYRFADSSGAI